jgi:hypothetical protein
MTTPTTLRALFDFKQRQCRCECPKHVTRLPVIASATDANRAVPTRRVTSRILAVMSHSERYATDWSEASAAVLPHVAQRPRRVTRCRPRCHLS